MKFRAWESAEGAQQLVVRAKDRAAEHEVLQERVRILIGWLVALDQGGILKKLTPPPTRSEKEKMIGTMNPYQKGDEMSASHRRWLLDDETPCAFCGQNEDGRKTLDRNVGQTNWREPYTDDNTFPLCWKCHKVRRGRTLRQMRRYARVVTQAHAREAPRWEAAARLYAAAEPTRGATVRSRTQLRKKYAVYAKRQGGHPVARCGGDRLGEGGVDGGEPLSFEDFERMLSGSTCFYCREMAATSLDRLDPRRCYAADNVVPACTECNKTKSNLAIAEFFVHLEKLSRRPRGGAAGVSF